MLFPTWNAISSFFCMRLRSDMTQLFSSDGVILFLRPSLSLSPFFPPTPLFYCYYSSLAVRETGRQRRTAKKKSIMPHIRESGFGGMSGGHKTPSSQFHLLSATAATIHTGVFFLQDSFFPYVPIHKNMFFFAVVKFEPISFYSTYFIATALLAIILLLLLILYFL